MTDTFKVGDVIERRDSGQRRIIARITPAGFGGTSYADGPVFHAAFIEADGTARKGGHVADIWSKSYGEPTSAWVLVTA